MRAATFGAWAGARSPGARLLVFVLACAAAVGACAQDVSIRTQRRGEALEIEGRARLAVPVAVAWAVLTDYEHLESCPTAYGSTSAGAVVGRLRTSGPHWGA